MTKFVELFFRFLIAPIAVGAGLFGRYGTGIEIIEIAWPMVIIFLVCYLIHSIILTYRHYNLFGDFITTALVSLFLTNLVAIGLLLINRFYYSLGYLFLFILISGIWTVAAEVFKVRHLGKRRFILVKTGNWQLLDSSNLVLTSVDSPEELRSLTIEGDILIDLRQPLTKDWTDILSDLRTKGCTITDIRDVVELSTGRVFLSTVASDPSLIRWTENYYLPIKRIADILVSLLALLITFPLLVIFAISIWLTSRGSPIFKQQRVGLHGKEFTIYKLRTMYAPDNFNVTFTGTNDDRITVLGRFLRRWRIDEWPQFVNVLRGDMSIVGPRPERPEWEAIYNIDIPYFSLRHFVRPGITGWSQIHFGYASNKIEAESKTEFDLYYIKYFSLTLDITIMIQTVVVILTGRGYR
ncbi:MAG: hypothetical protein CL398_01915 [Acidiferrobacteraceae bacterium]|nr:hypothetical protein [Acidiferrobacteraceae bacterium]